MSLVDKVGSTLWRCPSPVVREIWDDRSRRCWSQFSKEHDLWWSRERESTFGGVMCQRKGEQWSEIKMSLPRRYKHNHPCSSNIYEESDDFAWSNRLLNIRKTAWASTPVNTVDNQTPSVLFSFWLRSSLHFLIMNIYKYIYVNLWMNLHRDHKHPIFTKRRRSRSSLWSQSNRKISPATTVCFSS